MVDRRDLERIWNDPKVRSPTRIAGLLPVESAAALELGGVEPDGNRPGFIQRQKRRELCPKSGNVKTVTVRVPIDEELVTVPGREVRIARVPAVQWSDPPLAKQRRR